MEKRDTIGGRRKRGRMSYGGPLGGTGKALSGLPRVLAVRNADECGLRRRQPHGGDNVRRRGPRRARGRAGRALCRQGGAAARRYARHHRSRPHDGLHREHRQVPPAAEPRSARRGAGRLHRLSARAGDAASPEADRLPRPHRGDAPDPRGLQDHARAWAVGEKGRL